MFSKLKNLTQDQKDKILDSHRARLREKAIRNAKASIALVGKKVSDYDEDQLEVIVQKEEEKIMEKYKNSAVFGVLALFGIGFF